MKFKVTGYRPDRFDQWVEKYNRQHKHITKITKHASCYEVNGDVFPVMLFSEIIKEFPDLEFEGTQGEFEVRDRYIKVLYPGIDAI